MSETLTLTTPISASTTGYSVRRLDLDWDASAISIRVRSSLGVDITANYDGSIALTLMTQLNKIDLTVKSLQKRILERLVTDGKLPAGSVTGSPD